MASQQDVLAEDVLIHGSDDYDLTGPLFALQISLEDPLSHGDYVGKPRHEASQSRYHVQHTKRAVVRTNCKPTPECVRVGKSRKGLDHMQFKQTFRLSPLSDVAWGTMEVKHVGTRARMPLGAGKLQTPYASVHALHGAAQSRSCDKFLTQPSRLYFFRKKVLNYFTELAYLVCYLRSVNP